MKKLLFLLVSFIFSISCDKFEWYNPYDPECPKPLFTPSTPGAQMEGNSVKLTWSQDNDNISSFALFRRAEGESITNLATTQKTTTQYLDASIIPGKKYTYYVLAVAGENKSDTVKAEITPVIPITISTGSVTEIGATTAKIGGNITNAGGGTVTSRGICWSTTQNPTVSNSKTTEGTGPGQYTSTLTGLLAGITYYARAYGENSRGIVYGNEVSFTTLGSPKLTTNSVTSITSTSAVSGGNITSDGGFSITARGVCWSTTPSPTVNSSKTVDGAGIGNFVSQLVGLKSLTNYFLRAYATNSFTTVYGEQITFSTPIGSLFTNGAGVTDVEGNSYKTVVIGTQEWMGENLKVTKLRDGTSIPNLISKTEWAGTNSPAYCNFFNEPAKGETYGKLYNYYTVIDNRNLCPIGWHVPTFDEFLLLENHLGASEAGKLMKSSIGWNFWSDSLQGNGNNLSGFNGLPGGRRGGIAENFQDDASIGYWWTTTEFSSSTAKCIALSRENYLMGRVVHNKINGLSVRCIKN
ncbi:MAG: hypothetical protein FJX83_05925 [Bacteroidetes bacterium]|nr:hypothetical protein [Bacteroidota bacterium]